LRSHIPTDDHSKPSTEADPDLNWGKDHKDHDFQPYAFPNGKFGEGRPGSENKGNKLQLSYRNIRLYGPDKLFRSKPETRTRLSGNAWEPYALPNREFGEGWEVRRKIENNYYRNIRLHGPGIPGESAVRIIKPICLLFRVLNLLRSVVSYY